MKKILVLLNIFMVTLPCFSQTHFIVSEYRTITNGKEMQIILFSDSTYDFNTYWGKYHGFWKVYENEEDSLFDRIYFYDDYFTTKNAFHYSYISLNDTLVKQTDTLNDSSKYYFVTMFDLTGDSVPYYYVCFVDFAYCIIDIQYNPNRESQQYIHYIPINTKKIEMIGEYGNLSTYFRCDYSTRDGNIAFIIGPSVGRFYINKEREIISYKPCYCDNHYMSCSVSFNKYRN